MEPIITSADNQQETDNLIGKLDQGSDELWEKMAQTNSNGGVINIEELVDLYNSYCGDNSYSTSPQSTQEQTTAVLQDLNNYESTNIENINGLNTDTEIQDSEMMFEDASEYDAVNTNSHAGVGSTSSCKEVIDIRYGDLNYFGAGVSGIGRILGGPFMNIPQQVGVTKEINDSNTVRNRMKRKYRGVIETAEETVRRLEITKIKNREAATKAQETRKEREGLLRARLSMVLRKNEFLKKVIKVMDNNRRINLQPEPLRRTKSGL